MVRQCVECGKKMPESQESDYCDRCDELLDKKFDEIKSNIIVFKELRDDEIEVLDKFEKEDIKDLYLEIYESMREDGQFDENEGRVLKKLQEKLDLTAKDIGSDKIIDLKKCREIKREKKLICTKCDKKLKEDFNFCPYCGKKIEMPL